MCRSRRGLRSGGFSRRGGDKAKPSCGWTELVFLTGLKVWVENTAQRLRWLDGFLG